MDDDNSVLVGYEIDPVGPGCSPYPPEASWADPDLDEAAELMRGPSSPSRSGPARSAGEATGTSSSGTRRRRVLPSWPVRLAAARGRGSPIRAPLVPPASGPPTLPGSPGVSGPSPAGPTALGWLTQGPASSNGRNCRLRDAPLVAPPRRGSRRRVGARTAPSRDRTSSQRCSSTHDAARPDEPPRPARSPDRRPRPVAPERRRDRARCRRLRPDTRRGGVGPVGRRLVVAAGRCCVPGPSRAAAPIAGSIAVRARGARRGSTARRRCRPPGPRGARRARAPRSRSGSCLAVRARRADPPTSTSTSRRHRHVHAVRTVRTGEAARLVPEVEGTEPVLQPAGEPRRPPVRPGEDDRSSDRDDGGAPGIHGEMRCYPATGRQGVVVEEQHDLATGRSDARGAGGPARHRARARGERRVGPAPEPTTLGATHRSRRATRCRRR